MYTLFPICPAIVIAQAGPYPSGKKNNSALMLTKLVMDSIQVYLKGIVFGAPFENKAVPFCSNWGNFAVIID